MKAELGFNAFKTLLNWMSARARCDVLEADEILPDDRDPPDHVSAVRRRRKISLKEKADSIERVAVVAAPGSFPPAVGELSGTT